MKEGIGTILFGLGLCCVIVFAETLEQSYTFFGISEGVSLLMMTVGALIVNSIKETAEADTPAESEDRKDGHHSLNTEQR